MEPTILTISRAATLALCAALYAAQGYAHGEHAKRDAPLGAQQEHARHRLPQTVGEAQRVSIRLENLQLLDQHNQAVRFAEQVVGDQLIALSIFYSSCTTVCPVIAEIFAQVQQRLGARLGEEVQLVFLSVDPTQDTPRRLAAHARKFDAGAGWTWLTGQKLAVDDVLNGLGLYTADYTEHPAAVLIGDGRSGQWSRFYGFPSATQIVAELERMALARQSSGDNDSHLAKE